MVFTISSEMDSSTPAMTGLVTATRAPTSSATGLLWRPSLISKAAV
jgi:hypothetical protein